MRRSLPAPIPTVYKYRYRTLESILFLILLSFIFYKAGSGTNGPFVRFLSSIPYNRTQQFLTERSAMLQDVNDKAAHDPALIEALRAGDQDAILAYAVGLKNRYDVDIVTVTDKNGFVVSRARTQNFRGDNLFLNTPYGYKVGKGEAVTAYSQTLLDPHQGGALAGIPVMDEGHLLGSVFVADLFDDSFAHAVASTYLNPQTQVVFYAKDIGILSSSFTDNDSKTLGKVLNPGSRWIASGLDSGVLEYKGSYYYVRNLKLPSYEGSSHLGALVLLPLYIDVQFAIFFILTLIAVLWVWHPVLRRLKHTGREFRTVEVLVAGSVTLFTILMAAVFYGRLYFQVKDVAVPELSIYNSTMRFSPESGVFDQLSEQRIRVMVDTGGEDINSVGAKLSYDKNAFTVVGIDTSTSECRSYLEKSFDPETGKIDLVCLLKLKKERPTSFDVGTIIIQPTRPGNTVLHIENDSEVLANDGFATNVLRLTTDAAYTIVDSNDFVWNDQLAKNKKLVVHSISHPNAARWYSNDKVSFVWSAAKGDAFSYILSKKSGNVIAIGTTTENKVTLTVPESAEYELFVKASSQGETLATGTTSVKVDITPPENVNVVVSHYSIKVGEVVRMLLSGDDMESGLAANYYVSIDGHTLLPVGGLVFIPFSSSGAKEVTVRIFDKAGNYVDRTKFISVK
jgi:hypothetical protein